MNNKKLSKTCIAFPDITNIKDRKDICKKVADNTRRLKNYCRQKNINYIKNASINEDLWGVKKLYLNRKGNSYFAKNLLKYFNIVWLGLNTVRYESFLKINYCRDSRVDYFKEIRQLQGNTIRILRGPTQRPNIRIEKKTRSLTLSNKRSEKGLFVI